MTCDLYGMPTISAANYRPINHLPLGCRGKCAVHAQFLKHMVFAFSAHQPGQSLLATRHREPKGGVMCQGALIEGCDLAEPLADTRRPVFYTHTLCPYAHRAWLALLEKVTDLIVSCNLHTFLHEDSCSFHSDIHALLVEIHSEKGKTLYRP